ncbi:cytochrome P450 [Phytohabitans houttuyneae]|uniref:Cytochrome P450 n=1 Tax=Phytohabitans houttuyneae TaxID=1076126 RepID=A0A6V8KII6_9ACTN|nr:cytochrome P450 [Phytohabitans houttuyneae]GFJ81517.1 cytochrome P450 [Phytohabitans houttuyneae]
MTMSDQDLATTQDVLIRLMMPDAVQNPYPIYAELLEHSPIYRSQFGAYLVCRYSDAEFVLKHPELFPGVHPEAMEQMFPQAAEHEAYEVLVTSLVGSNPPKHTRLRHLVGNGFTARRVADLRASMEAWSDRMLAELVERLHAGETVDLHNSVSLPMPMHMISDLLGVPESDRRQLARQVPEMMNVVDPAASPEAVLAADAAFQDLGGYFDGLIEERRRAPRDDLVSALVSARDEGSDRLTDAELRNLLFSLWAAGFETTATAIDNAVLLLLEEPSRAAWLDTAERTAAFVDETLRYEPSVQVAPGIRFAAEAVELSGYELPEGAQVRLMLGAASRDPAAYRDPDVFDPGRTGPHPLSFGSGIHYCLGAGLARLEMGVLLPRLYKAAPNLALAGPPVRRRSVPLRDFNSLPVTLAG